MGYGIAPDLTTGEFMCLEPCQHTDCAALRRDFIENADCKICGEPIKAGDKFYYVEQDHAPRKQDKVHFVCRICELERIDKERANDQ